MCGIARALALRSPRRRHTAGFPQKHTDITRTVAVTCLISTHIHQTPPLPCPLPIVAQHQPRGPLQRPDAALASLPTHSHNSTHQQHAALHARDHGRAHTRANEKDKTLHATQHAACAETLHNRQQARTLHARALLTYCTADPAHSTKNAHQRCVRTDTQAQRETHTHTHTHTQTVTHTHPYSQPHARVLRAQPARRRSARTRPRTHTHPAHTAAACRALSPVASTRTSCPPRRVSGACQCACRRGCRSESQSPVKRRVSVGRCG